MLGYGEQRLLGRGTQQDKHAPCPGMLLLLMSLQLVWCCPVWCCCVE